MKRMIFVLLIIILFFATVLLAQEQITLTTYYPAPFGAYDRIKLVPRETLPDNPYCDDEEDAGIIYYDNGKGEKEEGLYICQKTDKGIFEWIYISRPISKEEEVKPDPKKITYEKVVCVKEDGTLGICLNNPSFDGTCACQ